MAQLKSVLHSGGWPASVVFETGTRVLENSKCHSQGGTSRARREEKDLLVSARSHSFFSSAHHLHIHNRSADETASYNARPHSLTHIFNAPSAAVPVYYVPTTNTNKSPAEPVLIYVKQRRWHRKFNECALRTQRSEMKLRIFDPLTSSSTDQIYHLYG